MKRVILLLLLLFLINGCIEQEKISQLNPKDMLTLRDCTNELKNQEAECLYQFSKVPEKMNFSINGEDKLLPSKRTTNIQDCIDELNNLKPGFVDNNNNEFACVIAEVRYPSRSRDRLETDCICYYVE